MRRKDRELTPEQAWEIVDRCGYGVLSMLDEAGMPYGVPLNFAREGYSVYFHSALEGKKADCLRCRSRVCLTCVEDGPTIDQPALTTRYASAILRGTAAEVTEPEEKIHALRLLCRKLAPENPEGRGGFESCLDATAVWRITVEEITGKANRK